MIWNLVAGLLIIYFVLLLTSTTFGGLVHLLLLGIPVLIMVGLARRRQATS